MCAFVYLGEYTSETNRITLICLLPSFILVVKLREVGPMHEKGPVVLVVRLNLLHAILGCAQKGQTSSETQQKKHTRGFVSIWGVRTLFPAHLFCFFTRPRLRQSDARVRAGALSSCAVRRARSQQKRNACNIHEHALLCAVLFCFVWNALQCNATRLCCCCRSWLSDVYPKRRDELSRGANRARLFPKQTDCSHFFTTTCKLTQCFSTLCKPVLQICSIFPGKV
jgi:hypothetical protein